MRRSWPLGLLVSVLLIGGCDLKKDDDCVTDPGLTQGGSTICTKPSPPQFSKLDQPGY